MASSGRGRSQHDTRPRSISGQARISPIRIAVCFSQNQNSVLMQRREGLAKLTGRERYVDDVPLEGGLWGMTVRSPVSRGRITAVRFRSDVDWSQVVVVDHRDVPGPNEIVLIERDQPVLAAEYVRHVHEPVVLIAHASRETARRAARAVEVVVA